LFFESCLLFLNLLQIIIFAFYKSIMQEFSPLKAISAIDGRYRHKTEVLASYFSEQALIQYRIFVELEYFIALCKLPLPQLNEIGKDKQEEIRSIYKNFSFKDASQIKEIEKTTNHDVKAVEYFIKEKFDAINLSDYKEFIHFGLTSQDINNTAIPLSVKEAFQEVYLKILNELIAKLKNLSLEWSSIPMLARTHGQPASPTRLGKEINVFVERIEQQIKLLSNVPFAAKFGGATGNYNAHQIAYPNINWRFFGQKFVEKTLGLHYSFPTTQIEHYDHFAAFCDTLKRINTIVIDLNKDMWTYISMEYFKQKINKNEIGSSAMPHKVNPIDFENSEGNLGVANAIFEHLSAKLPISRLQRDLTDSTVLRNIGLPFAHILIGFDSTLKGLNKLVLNQEKIEDDLHKNWVVVAEAIQTILRRENYPAPYETLKKLTRTTLAIDKNTIHTFIKTLNVSDPIKEELLKITPQNYLGI